ncbi:hypothetical protein ARMSODRAFT_955665 [Armillaria solidipes]|uniref:Non-haem dioxygenase N-terminal domain-containing protein n=1 Tax=Armillaria solidipes TaxID=1076256 RepID=A0A2H3BVC2_9AGAR|nr:hypothetical protein ARMSODRAFT_955665 [Armillaria solidipes]
MTTPHVPVLSLTNCNAPERKAEIVRQIGETCTHQDSYSRSPVPQALIERASETSVRFFVLPVEEKLAFARDPWTNRWHEILERQSLQGVFGHDELGISSRPRRLGLQEQDWIQK